ncbi:MAG TPA: hypothetical protein VM049_05335 [Gaiellaceae bacterium]|nr:hypothetical protein [Gaiellaceae bacterium]
MSSGPGPGRARLPFRYSVMVISTLAGLIVLIAWATGGDLRRALVFAGAYFVIASAWAWWRSRQRSASESP